MTSENICANEFNIQYFGFYCDDKENSTFYVTSFGRSKSAYLLYRILIWTYKISWFLAYYIDRGINNPDALRNDYKYFTAWGYNLDVIYFTVALVFAVSGFIKKNNSGDMDTLATKLLRSMTWMLQSTCQTSAILIVLGYWVAVTLYSPGEPNAFNVDRHGVNALLFVIERIFVAFPMRLLHFIYPMIFGTIYIIFTVILHAIGDDSAVYPVLDWQNMPALAAGLSVVTIFIIVPLTHSILFGTYCLRIYLSGRCAKRRVSPASDETVQKEKYDSNSESSFVR